MLSPGTSWGCIRTNSRGLPSLLCRDSVPWALAAAGCVGMSPAMLCKPETASPEWHPVEHPGRCSKEEARASQKMCNLSSFQRESKPEILTTFLATRFSRDDPLTCAWPNPTMGSGGRGALVRPGFSYGLADFSCPPTCTAPETLVGG